MSSLLLTPDGKSLISGSTDKTVTVSLIHISTAPLFLSQGHSAFVSSLLLTPDGKTLSSGSTDKTGRLITTPPQRTAAHSLHQGHSAFASSLPLTPLPLTPLLLPLTHARLARCPLPCVRATLPLRLPYSSHPSPSPAPLTQGHSAFVSSLLLTPDGKTLISGSTDKTVRLWRLSTGACLATHEVRVVADLSDCGTNRNLFMCATT